jgi:hypothetical protein
MKRYCGRVSVDFLLQFLPQLYVDENYVGWVAVLLTNNGIGNISVLELIYWQGNGNVLSSWCETEHSDLLIQSTE